LNKGYSNGIFNPATHLKRWNDESKMIGRFSGRDIVEKPSCPFCGALIERPKELAARMPNEMPVGACVCGAVYACDVTGHNLGTAMIDALLFACNGDWDLAWSLLPEEDYVENELDQYDFETHLVVHSGAYEGRNISGVLYFIRLHQDIREVTEPGFRKEIEKAPPQAATSLGSQRRRKKLNKQDVEGLVQRYDVNALVSAAEEDRRLIRSMQRLLVSVEPLKRLRAADMMGKASAAVSKKHPGYISRLLQGLCTAVTDTAASSWGYIDAIGEIIANQPDQFASYLPQLFSCLKDRALIPETLRALGKVAYRRPALLRKKAHLFSPLLQDQSPEIRGHTVILLGFLKAREAKEALGRLLKDDETLTVYRDGQFEIYTIGVLAAQAIEDL
jgi:hypothetical protein